MNLPSIQANFNRGQMSIDEIKWLIDTVEKQEREYVTLSQSIEEDDAMIQHLQDVVKAHQLHEAILLERVKKAESNTRFHKCMELEQLNLALVQEIAWYQEMLKGQQPAVLNK